MVLFHFFQGCNPLLLGDNSSVSSSTSCDAPYRTRAIHNGIACYDEARIGSTAIYYCLDCGFKTIKGYSTRTCLSNGSWSGMVPQCNCEVSSEQVTSANEIRVNESVFSTTTIDDNKFVMSINTDNTTINDENIGFSHISISLIIGVSVTSGTLLVSIIVIVVLFLMLISTLISRRKVKLELIELQ